MEHPSPEALSWLQNWYAAHCDGEWEHRQGVTIESLDNPGWRMSIDLRGTALAGRPFDRVEVRRSDLEWLDMWVDDDVFGAACGPLGLGETIDAFRVWAEG